MAAEYKPPKQREKSGKWILAFDQNRLTTILCSNGTWSVKIGEARIFDSEKEANETAWYHGNPKLYRTVNLSNATLLRIEKYKLRSAAKELFGLPYATPIAVLADRYEDEGMMEEASKLRFKWRNA